MIKNRFNEDRLEHWCKQLPECSKFLRRFFAPIKANVEMHKSLMDYMDNVNKGMTQKDYAEQYGMVPEDFKNFHQQLMDAYHDIIVVDANLKKTVY